jgi:hypothetical protein
VQVFFSQVSYSCSHCVALPDWLLSLSSKHPGLFRFAAHSVLCI